MVKELAIKNIKKYNQNNPFNSTTENDKWLQYNKTYQHELFKHLETVDYKEYYDKVFEYEKSNGQLLMI